MATAWGDLSKDERSKFEGKKAYNRQHGLERYAPGGSLEHKADNYKPSPTSNANWEQSKSLAQGFQAGQSASYTKQDHVNRMEQGKTPHVSSLQDGYATDRLYVSPDYDGKLYTAKEADDAGWTPGYYNNDHKYMPQTYDDPNSPEAIAGRQDYLKRRNDTGSKEYEVWNRMDSSQKVYDPSVHEGYNDYSDWSDRLKNQDAEKAYRQQMEDQNIDFQKQHNHTFDMERGYYVPNQFARNQRASMYDNMYMRGGSDQARLGDRYDYIHKFYDPLKGTFKYT